MSDELNQSLADSSDARTRGSEALLGRWLTTPSETEQCEFKEAKEQFSLTKAIEYCAAIANEGGGFLVLGVSDKPPRRVVGSNSFPSQDSVNKLKLRVLEKLNIRIEVDQVDHPDGRVLVLSILSRPVGHPIQVDGKFLMRSGESLVPMNQGRLKQIFREDQQNWFLESSMSVVSPVQVVSLLDTQAYFDLLGRPYPESRDAVIDTLEKARLVTQRPMGVEITNLAALLLAKDLSKFSPSLSRKAPRVVIYDGQGKLRTLDERVGTRGYACSFESLVNFVHSRAPNNHYIEEAIREEVKMFPKQALRELIANALVHQDFALSGGSVLIEMFSDRVEISNPGAPAIRIERFIDEHRSRNEFLATIMRNLGICEEKGSGIDKVITAAEVFQLRAPDFRSGETRTTAVLFAHREFSKMSRDDRIRACYQHCCLLHVSNRQMSNQSLRERFKLPASKAPNVSQIISEAKELGLIKQAETGSDSTRYARYTPSWA